MNIDKKTISSSLWFSAEVLGIFVVIQLIRSIIGNLDAFYSGLSLILIAAVLFIIVFLVARHRDNNSNRKPGTKTYSNSLS